MAERWRGGELPANLNRYRRSRHVFKMAAEVGGKMAAAVTPWAEKDGLHEVGRHVRAVFVAADGANFLEHFFVD